MLSTNQKQRKLYKAIFAVNGMESVHILKKHRKILHSKKRRGYSKKVSIYENKNIKRNKSNYTIQVIKLYKLNRKKNQVNIKFNLLKDTRKSFQKHFIAFIIVRKCFQK